MTECPNSSAINSAVSASRKSLILTMTPCCIKDFITSTPLSAIRFESSWTVIDSGIITFLAIFSLGVSVKIAFFFAFSCLLLIEARDLCLSFSFNASEIVSLPFLLFCGSLLGFFVDLSLSSPLVSFFLDV